MGKTIFVSLILLLAGPLAGCGAGGAAGPSSSESEVCDVAKAYLAAQIETPIERLSCERFVSQDDQASIYVMRTQPGADTSDDAFQITLQRYEREGWVAENWVRP